MSIRPPHRWLHTAFVNVFPARHAVLAAAAFTIGALAASPVSAQARQATYLQYQTAIPEGWTSRAPTSSMRLAEFTAAGSAEVVVYFFGPGQGGSPQANLDRWKSQFSNPDGDAVYEKVMHDTTGAFPITIAEYRGTYARGIGAGSDADAARPGNTLLAAVVETPRGTLFFQCFGPTAAVEAQRAAYLAFVKGLK